MESALISIFIGQFLIGLLFKPALDRLQEIRKQILDIRPPARGWLARLAGAGQQNEHDEEAAENRARQALDEASHQYRLAYKPFKRIGLAFLIVLVALSNLALFVSNPPAPWAFVGHITLTGFLLFFAWFFSDAAYPSPNELMTLDYLVGNFPNLHKETLIDMARLRPIGGHLNGRLTIVLGSNLPLTGYKYFVALTDREVTRCFYVICGHVQKDTMLDNVLRPGFSEYFHTLSTIDLAPFLRQRIALDAHLLAFFPEPKGWHPGPTSPCYVAYDIADIRADGSLWVGAPRACRSDELNKRIKFERRFNVALEQWKIVETDTTPHDGEERLVSLLAEYRGDLERCSSPVLLNRMGAPEVRIY